MRPNLRHVIIMWWKNHRIIKMLNSLGFTVIDSFSHYKPRTKIWISYSPLPKTFHGAYWCDFVIIIEILIILAQTFRKNPQWPSWALKWCNDNSACSFASFFLSDVFHDVQVFPSPKLPIWSARNYLKRVQNI